MFLSRGAAAVEGIEIQNVQLGINGYFLVGCLAPIEFEVTSTGRSSSSPLTVIPQIRTVDPDGHGVIITLAPVTVGVEPVRVQSLFRSGKLDAPVQIELLREKQTIAQQTIRVNGNGPARCLRQDAHIWLIADEQPAYSAAYEKLHLAQPNSIHLAVFQDVIEKISDPSMLQSVNLIVINAGTRISPSASKLLQKWVQRGGRLVISVGGDVAPLQQGTLSSWLPFLPEEVIEIRSLNALNQLVPGSGPLRLLGSVSGARFDPTDGKVLTSGLGTPLALRAAYGSGIVTMLSVRQDQKPLNTWGARSELAMLLAGFDANWKKSQNSNTLDAELNPTGVTDLQTQIIHSLDEYDDIPRPSYWVVIAWSACILILIGPLDYLLVHYLLRRPQLTWITLPVWVTVVTCCSYSAAFSTNSISGQAQLIEMIDVDLSTQRVRGRSWMNFYNTQTRRNQLEASVDLESAILKPSDPKQDRVSNSNVSFTQTSWIERPETSYRGMYRSGGLETQKPVYHLSLDHRTIPDLPSRIYSTNALGTEWESVLDSANIVAANLLDPGTGRLTGAITYSGPQELTEWFVAYGNFAYFPRTQRGETQKSLLPGDVFQLQDSRSNLLRGVLIGLTHTSIFSEDKKKSTAQVSKQQYDPLGRDPYSILRTLTFHQVTGSESFTGLNNHTLRTSDLSPLLELHRAVLFGKLKNPITQFSINGEPITCQQQDSVLRILLPVEYEQINVDAPPDPTLLKIK